MIAAVWSLIGSLLVMNGLSNTHPSSATLESTYYLMHYCWVAWLFMLIPVGCLVYGILSKRKKNVAVGIVFAGLLLIVGCFYFVGLKQYATDLAYLEGLEAELGLSLPEERSIITEDWTKGTQTSSDDIYYKYDSVARFYDAGEVSAFLSTLDAGKWHSETEPFAGVIPVLAELQTRDCAYFLLYCRETKNFAETEAMPQYNYIYMAWDTEESVLHITEFIQK